MTVKDFPDSIKAILYDRIVSPLSGTFIFSWLVWNWKLVYFFLVFDGTYTIVGKIDYISSHYNNWYVLILFPLLSTAFLILLYPYISTQAYKVHLKYKVWQNSIKNKIEDNQLLTREQSLKIRLEMKNQIDKFLELERSKDEEIEILKIENQKLSKLAEENEELKLKLSEFNDISQKNRDALSLELKKSENTTKLISIIKDIVRKGFTSEFEKIITLIFNEEAIYYPNFKEVLDYLLLGQIIKLGDVEHPSISNRYYELTDFGKSVLSTYYEMKIDDEENPPKPKSESRRPFKTPESNS